MHFIMSVHSSTGNKDLEGEDKIVFVEFHK